jgi:hypothetical protein
MAQRHESTGPPNRIVPRQATFPVRRPERTTYVTVPVDWPERIRYSGKTYVLTGKRGHRVSDEAQAAEYEAVKHPGRRPRRPSSA